ncbi:MAG: pyridoxine 5'-phosphate synthase [Bacteroidia bacterium]
MPRTKLSVNINKIATLRNARGGNVPDLIKVAQDIERFGADGITVHPRPDERHIRFSDVYELKKNITTEFNIEGYPSKQFLSLVEEIKPIQVTLVPDGPDVITSNTGWDTEKNKSFLKDIISQIKSHGIRVSIFINPDLKMIEHASETGTDRVELYTEAYAKKHFQEKEKGIAPYVKAAQLAGKLNIGVNAGHDLNLENLNYFFINVPNLLEVSIGHALISDALYYGLENTVQMYKRKLSG